MCLFLCAWRVSLNRMISNKPQNLNGLQQQRFISCPQVCKWLRLGSAWRGSVVLFHTSFHWETQAQENHYFVHAVLMKEDIILRKWWEACSTSYKAFLGITTLSLSQYFISQSKSQGPAQNQWSGNILCPQRSCAEGGDE